MKIIEDSLKHFYKDTYEKVKKCNSELLNRCPKIILEECRITMQLLEERLKFEELISRLSAGFLNLSFNEIDNAIKNALREVTEFLHLDRSYIYEVIEEENTFRQTCGYNSPGVRVMPSWVNEKTFPWVASEILSGRIVNIAGLKDVPEDAPVDKENYLKLSLKNEIVLPMSVEGKIAGAITLAIDKEAFSWPEPLVKQLILIAHIIASALSRRKNEEKNRKLREELFQVTRCITMGELSASLTHELNQPLCSIMTDAETGLRFISGSKPDVDEIRTILEDIISATKRASNVITGLKGMFKKEEKKFKILDINEVFINSINLLHSTIAIKCIKINMKFPSEPLYIYGDNVKLQQVIINLILNASESMDNSSGEYREILIGTEKIDNEHIKIFIRDRGHGIKEGEKDKIFLPFYTGKSGGMGMGLSITKSIIEEHNGKVYAENNPDRGATFYFILPLVKEKEEGAVVYIVDDDLMVRKSIERLLKSEGYRLKSFISAVDFLKEETYEKHSCILLDVSMPSMSGLELQEQFKELNINIPVIFISGQNDMASGVQAIKNGALDFLCKPFKNMELLKVIQKAMEKNTTSREEKEKIEKREENFKKLTVREEEIFNLVVSGMLNKQIANKLGITEHTVKMHRKHIMKKLDASSLADLIR
ncbi:MAG: response regulator, partial [Candidatus Eremiobacterota bacterium]